MENMMKKHILLRELTKQKGGVLDNHYPDYHAINMMHNHVTMALELCSHYTSQWAQKSGIKESDLSDEQKGRLVMITRDTFIHAMSVCEYCAKKIVLVKNHVDFQKIIDALNKDRNVYLGNIMGKSKGLGIISQKEYDNWDSFREIRNAIIHNNAVMTFNKEYKINGFTFSVEKDKQIHTKWDIFPYFVSIIIDQFNHWTEKIHNY